MQVPVSIAKLTTFVVYSMSSLEFQFNGTKQFGLSNKSKANGMKNQIFASWQSMTFAYYLGNMTTICHQP
jgi:hypothetical protein